MPVSTAGYLVVAALVLLAIVAVAVGAWRGRAGTGTRPLSALGAVAVALVVAGIVFGEPRWLGYGLMAAGVALSVVDILRRRRRSP